jgi:hypothetical protein
MALLKTISKAGKPPGSRVTDAPMAASLVQQCILADQLRAQKRTKIQGMIDGNPPYDSGELKRLGQSFRSNANFREAEGHIRARKTTYSNLLLDVPCLVTMKPAKSGYTEKDYGAIVAGRFSELLTRWEGFMFNMLLHQNELVTWGCGPMYWSHPRDWHFEALKYGSFLVPSMAKATLDKLDFAIIRGQYRAHELFYKISCTQEELDAGMTDAEKIKLAREQGWNPDVARRLIMKAAQEGSRTEDQYSTSRWESLQQQIKNSDTLYSTSDSELIYVSHVYVREFRGQVSHYVVPDGESESGKYLYQKKNEQESFPRQICLFFSDIGDGYYHSVKGMGAQIYAHCIVNNRMKNTMVDGAMMAASVFVQGDLANARIMRMGPVVLIQSGVQVVQGAFNPNLNALLEVSGKLEQNLARTSGTERPDLLDHPEDSRPTVVGEKSRMLREGRLERTTILLYYQQLDALYGETWRRLMNPDYAEVDPGYEDRKQFLKDCKDDGVPPELLKAEMFTIEATRALGLGSPVSAREAMDHIVGLAPYMDELGKVNAVRDDLALVCGYRQVDRYLPEVNRNSVPSNEHSMAQLENNDLMAAETCVVGQNQLHVIHIMVHMAPLVKIAEGLAATGTTSDNILKTHDYFLTALHHIAEHMEIIKDDSARKAEYKQFTVHFDELMKVYSKLSKMAADARQQLQADQEAKLKAMQEAGANNPEVAAKLAAVQSDFQIRLIKEKNDNAVSTAKAEHKMGILSALTQHKINLESQAANSKPTAK